MPSTPPRPALVTGAQQGIGAAIALALAESGADIAVNYLDDSAAAEALCDRIRALGRRAVPLQADLSQPGAPAALVEAAAGALGGLGVLVNNAGIFPRIPFLEMQEAQWDAVLDLNLKASAFCGQAAARAMLAAGQGGVILNLSSSAVRGSPLGAHYSASKAGLIGLTRAMALALGPHRIRVNAIAPGLTDTAQPRHGNSEAELRAMAESLPLGRMGRPEEIGAMAAYLASPAAAWITGQVFHVNGGGYMG
ncbi:SDR family NAD(P)-dependent oxidoreductase [Pseudoroseomonas cervicalis]|uniref:SDR family NAD(P)-dependent oxidoreductase n=1 Tax=Teichococcus cervicalis TaxID=204525 RepID=UPI0022F167F7|nr:SDR family oxidoreductase [Pseudoroseomonas cervicalis]WBV42254.1 SDR family oxidoreductase [Pseudoroseomonas cervicalis]